MAVIEKRKTRQGLIKYRVKVRIKGHPVQSETFTRLTDARRWAQKTETTIREGLYFPRAESRKHTLSELIDRYTVEVLPHHKAKWVSDLKPRLDWWKEEIGAYLVSEISQALIVQCREKLVREPIRGSKLRSPTSANRYLGALSHVLTIAVNEWNWLDDNPMRKVKKFREPRGRTRFLTNDELEQLLTACEKSRCSCLSLANVIGSNIFNLCFILGGVALLVPNGLKCDVTLVRRDGPVLLLSTVLLFLCIGSGLKGNEIALLSNVGILNLRLERWEGLLLLSVLIGYVYLLFLKFQQSVSTHVNEREAVLSETSVATYFRYGVGVVTGLILVIAGCHVMVGAVESLQTGVEGYGALWFAQKWGVPDYVVGVTIVAAGTSAPEFMVSLVAALRGSYGISVGNLLGSDIFNILGVVGLSGIILQPPLAPAVSVSPAVGPTLLALSAVVLCVVFFMHTGERVSRREGAILLMIGLIRWVAEFTG